MRKIIETPVYMTIEEIEKQFVGKWVFVANCTDGDGRTTGGIPVAVADTQFEGYEDGFYDRFLTLEYKPTLALNLNYSFVPMMTMMFFDSQEDFGNWK